MKRQVQADEKVKEQETSMRSSYGREDRKENSVKSGVPDVSNREPTKCNNRRAT